MTEAAGQPGLDPDGLAGQLSRQRRARLRRDRAQGAAGAGRRRELEPGDEIVFYVTGVQAFGAIARVRSAMFEDRTPIWPQGAKRKPEAYPWRVDAEPVIVLEEADFIPAEELADDLEHVRKWPPEHWQLAFQGQLRSVARGRRGAAARAESRRRPESRLDPRAPLHRRGGQRAARRPWTGAAPASRGQRAAHRRRGPFPARRRRVHERRRRARAARSARRSSRCADGCSRRCRDPGSSSATSIAG